MTSGPDSGSGSAATVSDGDASEGRAGLSIGAALAPLAVAWAIGIGRFPLNDNSFFTHLATGRLILEGGTVPSSDPYTFTAHGTDWTVQSWLASVAYAAVEQFAGGPGLRILVVTVFVAAAMVLLALSAPASGLLARVAIVFVPLAIGTELWSARPYMVGVLGLGLVWLALDERIPPWTMAPMLWIWAATHGSFPLSGALAVALIVGRAADRVPVRRQLHVLGWITGGIAASVVGPLMLRGLLFPARTFSRSDDLRRIVEWRAPDFVDVEDLLFLVLALAAFVGLVRRPSWRLTVPTVAFVAMALLARRNVVMALPVLVPVLAETLGDLGTMRVRDRLGIARAVGALSASMVVLAVLTLPSAPLTELDGYPTRPITWLAAVDPTGQVGRVATQDFTGNLLEVLDGPTGSVFIDDRVDMFPSALVADYQDLLDGRPAWSAVLDRWDIDAVIWERRRPLAQLLVASSDWHVVLGDEHWLLACRRSTSACEALLPGRS